MNNTEAWAWADRLEALGLAVRRRLIAARDAGHDMATAVAQEGGDTIFAIDRHVEPVIEEAIAHWPAECMPLTLIAEGMGESGTRDFPSPFGGEGAERSEAGAGELGQSKREIHARLRDDELSASAKSPLTSSVSPKGRGGQSHRFRLIIDPIDGTRNIMYDKRSAWFIAAVAEDGADANSRGSVTTHIAKLRDAFASTIVELPTTKAGFADTFTAIRGQPPRCRRAALQISDQKSEIRDLSIRPSAAPTLKNGFAQVANFFPGTKVLASELMERIARATLGEIEPGSAAVFDDQYITTAGQMVELMVGHDRFCADLRPLFYRVLSKQSGRDIRGLECHPYDVAGALVAQQAGVILTDGFGQSLDAPMDVHSGVHWCGYANESLRRAIEPVIQAYFKELGVKP